MRAAILTGSTENGSLVQVAEVPKPTIDENQILIKTIAVAVNPIDWKHIDHGLGGERAISGSDASGIVEAVGSSVKGYEVGDIVSTYLHGSIRSDRGAFAEYVIGYPYETIKYAKDGFQDEELTEGLHPAGKINTFEAAASVPFSLGTVAISFAYSLKIGFDREANSTKTILIWGGSTATGYLAVQVAKLVYGLKVAVTASSAHHEEFKRLGADYTFDYNDPQVVDKIRSTVGGCDYAFDTVSSQQTFQQTYDASSGKNVTIIDNLLRLGPDLLKLDPERHVEFTQTRVYISSKLSGEGNQKESKDLKVYEKFWYEIVPSIIEKIQHPRLKVLKKGLETSNEALVLSREGKVHHEKLVFRI